MKYILVGFPVLLFCSLLQAQTPSWIDITTYGAKGNGVTDDTAAMQAAIDACPSAGGTPTQNSYLISSKLNGVSHCNYLGVGPASKITYKSPGTDNYPMLYFAGASNVVVSGLNFSGRNSGGTVNLLWTNSEATINGQEGIFCLNCSDSEFHDNLFRNLAGAGLLSVQRQPG